MKKLMGLQIFLLFKAYMGKVMLDLFFHIKNCG